MLKKRSGWAFPKALVLVEPEIGVEDDDVGVGRAELEESFAVGVAGGRLGGRSGRRQGREIGGSGHGSSSRWGRRIGQSAGRAAGGERRRATFAGWGRLRPRPMLADPGEGLPRNRPPGTRDRERRETRNGRERAVDVPEGGQGGAMRRSGRRPLPSPVPGKRFAPPGMEPAEGAPRPTRPGTAPRHERTPLPALEPLASSAPLRSWCRPPRARRFRRLAGKEGPAGQRSTLDTVRSIFQRLDADRDGRVTAVERGTRRSAWPCSTSTTSTRARGSIATSSSCSTATS